MARRDCRASVHAGHDDYSRTRLISVAWAMVGIHLGSGFELRLRHRGAICLISGHAEVIMTALPISDDAHVAPRPGLRNPGPGGRAKNEDSLHPSKFNMDSGLWMLLST